MCLGLETNVKPNSVGKINNCYVVSCIYTPALSHSNMKFCHWGGESKKTEQNQKMHIVSICHKIFESVKRHAFQKLKSI